MPFSPARLPVLIWWDDGDVDLVCSTEQFGPLFRAQMDQRVSTQPHHPCPQLQPATLRVTEPLQIRHKALLVHQEAGLADSVAQGSDLESLASSGNQLQGI